MTAAPPAGPTTSRRTVITVPDHLGAERAIDRLSDRELPVEHAAIRTRLRVAVRPAVHA
jgi:hypothetical protein